MRLSRSSCACVASAAAAAAATAAHNPAVVTMSSRPIGACCRPASFASLPMARSGLWDASLSGSRSRPASSSRMTTAFPSRDCATTTTTMTGRRSHGCCTRLFAADFGSRQENGRQQGRLRTPMEPKLYPQRWVQLAYLSALALLSDWICFSVAASPSAFEASYPGHSAAALIDIFLFTNVATCFLVTDVVNRFGLGRAVKGASVVMALGCVLRSGPSLVSSLASVLGVGGTANSATAAAAAAAAASAPGLVPYGWVLAGTILVGAAQPFFQCTPPFLSATWFGSEERATSTAVALNFNQIGIATAFLVGGSMATDSDGLATYFAVIAAVCLAVTVGTLIQFQDRPPTPPSASEIEKYMNGHEEPPFLESVKVFFQTPGFSRPLAAFICSISITNIVGAFIDEVMERGGITSQFGIDLAGAGFELAILLGGIIIGGYVDKTKQYKDVTLKCIMFTMFVLLPLGLTEHFIGNQPILLVMALLGLGMACGPVQPINAELAVDVTYPGDETAVESVQQIGGNLVSALLVPVAEMAARQDYQLLPNNPALASDIRGDVVLLAALAGMTYVYFSGFDSPLRRTEADSGDGEDGVVIEVDVEAMQKFGSRANGKMMVGQDPTMEKEWMMVEKKQSRTGRNESFQRVRK